LQATGGILSIRWAHNGIVTTGAYCTAQGVIQQSGELGVALITLLLSVHTFVAAVLQVGLRARGVALSLVFLACVFDTLWVVIDPVIHKNYETPSPYWCWINPDKYMGTRLGGEYVWLWIALAFTVLYIPLYFWAEGFWSIDEGFKFHWWSPEQRVSYEQRRATLGMLLYPLTYSVIILPNSLTWWLYFAHHNIPSAAVLFSSTMFHLSGVINVFLFLIIRPQLLLFPRPSELRVDEQEIELELQDDSGAPNLSDTAVQSRLRLREV